MIGRLFDNRYRILEKLGSGGMAEVYLAHDHHLNRKVALKVLLPQYAADHKFVERFRREASSAAGLNHPNIVQIYDRGEAEGTYYIAMEYLEGHSLKEVVRRFAPLRPDHVVSTALQILEALRFAHRRDVIHRDIKPQNIMVDDEGRVKVTDFGIARAGADSSITETGSILGTAYYLSPEQAKGGQVEAASDLYSLGVVMYEMATGRLPFNGENPVAIAMQHVNEPPVPPSQLVSSVPEGLERAILRALAKVPEQRYLTAQAFLDDLVRVQRGEEVAPLPSAPIRGAVDEAETRVMTGPLSPVPVEPTQVRPTTVTPAEQRQAQPLHEAPVREVARKRGIWPWLLVILFVLALAGGLYALVAWAGMGGDLVIVPSLLGKTQQQAEEELRRAGLVLEVMPELKQGTRFAAGQVAQQNPAAGGKLERNGKVQVWLAALEKVVVPRVVGKTRTEAEAAIEAAKLRVGDVRTEISEDAAAGMVLKQDPPAGDEVEENTAVDLVVSGGPLPGVEVPDVTGMNQEEAIAALKQVKLVAKTLPRDSDRPEGEVVDQSPKKGQGQKVAEGSVVTLYVSNGSLRGVEVPPLVGRTLQEAKTALADLGLEAVAVPREDPKKTPGIVVEQDPIAGTPLKKGSAVKVWYTVVPPTSSTTSTTTVTTTSTTRSPTT